MPRPPSPPSSAPVPAPSRAAGVLWPATLTVTLGTFGGTLFLMAAHRLATAVLLGTLMALALCGFEALRRHHRAALAETERLSGELTRREAHAERRDADWHSYLAEQAELMRLELEHLVKQRLPAAVRGLEVPPARPESAALATVAADLFERVLREVAEESEYQEECRRLVLVELAGRVQSSAHRIQATVTGLTDRYPDDPDLLEATMRVDHAATQQARHAQSLKVLCGEWPGQQWQKPLALVDVARAASGRIVDFQRVEVSGAPDLAVTAPLAEPLIHLVAELLANATEYSPPRTSVPVTVRAVQKGAVIEVDDGGLGLDAFRLAKAKEIVSGRRPIGLRDVGEIPQTGLAVVGRFGRRHGFQVDLSPSPYGGLRAVVLVPAEALDQPVEPGRAEPRGGLARLSGDAPAEGMEGVVLEGPPEGVPGQPGPAVVLPRPSRSA
ncbi:ATP-binding protein [Streptomyces sp. NPDC049954]|uniref:ATP-binding protein n=1 Tax=Streptomyces sp. NPDC049954 TaxID=3155779 RepID=UPI003417A2AC